MKLRIEPGTTIGKLLEAYPEAESLLIDLAPAFVRLRNPVVRRTVAKVATLEQAAKIGGVSLRTLIGKLRALAGQSGDDGNFAAPEDGLGCAPDWVARARVVEEVDAAAMLERGVHPLGKIRQAVSALAPGEAVLLRAPFRPAPLLDTIRRAGVGVYCVSEGENYVVYFGRIA